MFDLDKQIDYWRTGAFTDIETAELSKQYLKRTKELLEWLVKKL